MSSEEVELASLAQQDLVMEFNEAFAAEINPEKTASLTFSDLWNAVPVEYSDRRSIDKVVLRLCYL